MVNRSKQKGTAFETACVDYLREHGFPYAERRAMRGSRDCGDIAGITGAVVECKALRQIDLATAMNEVEVERRNQGAALGFAFVKRRAKPVAQSYVVMSLEQFCALMRDDEPNQEGIAV